MRHIYDDFDDFEFASNPALARVMREQRREERRFATRRNTWRKAEDHFEIDEDDNLIDVDH